MQCGILYGRGVLILSEKLESKKKKEKEKEKPLLKIAQNHDYFVNK